MKNLLTCTLIILLSLNVYSQNNFLETNAALNNIKEFSHAGTWIPGKPLDNLISGTTYLFPNWIGKFEIVSKNGTKSKLFNLNYNIKSVTLESSISKDSVFQYDMQQIDYILTNNKKYKIISENKMNGLFEEIFSDEKIKLFKGFSIDILQGTFNPLTQEKMVNDKFIKINTYYFYIDNKFEKNKLNKNEVLNYLKDKKEKVKDFVSKYKMSYTNEEDVKSILQYYSSLN